MSVMDKFLNYMKLNDEDDEMDDFIDNDYLDEDDEPASVPQITKRRTVQREFDEPVMEEKPVVVKKTQPVPSSKVTPMRQPSSRRNQVGNGMEVCVIKPANVEFGLRLTSTHKLPTTINPYFNPGVIAVGMCPTRGIYLACRNTYCSHCRYCKC